MKRWWRPRIFCKTEKRTERDTPIWLSLRFFRKTAAPVVLVLLILLSGQGVFAERTVYVLSGSTGGGGPSAEHADSESLKPKDILDRMTLEQKIAQMMMPSVRDEDGGGNDLTELTPVAQGAIEKYSFCGYLFFSQNCQSTEQMVRLTSSMQQAAVDQNSGIRIPLLLSVDQEGGRIERIAGAVPTPGNMALGAALDTKAARETAGIIGSEMLAAGFNTDCAPVMDINSNPANPVINLRAFGGDASVVSEKGTAFVEGLSDSGVIPIMKHFPGHGDTATDSHTGLPVINKTMEELEQQELIPFQAGINAGAGAIMTAHIEFPAIEQDTYLSKSNGQPVALPATLSDDILTGLLRGRMGFDGVIITDALKMDAIRKHFDLVDAAELAINAGVDIILNPGDITTENHVAALEQYIQQIAARVESGSISEATIDDAVLRILRLKEKSGLLRETAQWQELTGQLVEKKIKNANKTMGSDAHREAIRRVTEQTTTLLKNEGQTLPVSEGKTVILCPEKNAAAVAEAALEELRNDGVLKSAAEVSVACYAGLQAVKASASVAGAQNVIAVSAAQSPEMIGKGGSSAFLRSAAVAAHKNGGRFILIGGFLPYEAAAYQDADAILLSYGYQSLTEIPADRAVETSICGPNLAAAIGAVFGAFSPSGSLPVDIPEMDASFQFTDSILYPSGYGIRNWNEVKQAERMTGRVSVPENAESKEEKKEQSGFAGDSKGSGSTEKDGASFLPVAPLKCGVAVVVALRYLFL